VSENREKQDFTLIPTIKVEFFRLILTKKYPPLSTVKASKPVAAFELRPNANTGCFSFPGRVAIEMQMDARQPAKRVVKYADDGRHPAQRRRIDIQFVLCPHQARPMSATASIHELLMRPFPDIKRSRLALCRGNRVARRIPFFQLQINGLQSS
jgi:hypothetical protein